MNYTLDILFEFERLIYRDGQLLTARDLSDDQRREAHLWALHVRYLHETWGIALGFGIRSLNAAAEPVSDGGTIIRVEPGYAVDDRGQMLLLATSTDLAVPALSEPAYRVLIMSYAKDANFHMQSDLLGNGSGNDRDMRSERPHFAWRRQEEVRPGPEVPLGQVLITNGAIQGSVDERVRRYVRPLARPHVVEGTTEPGRTGWRLWREGDRTLALEVTVDTSEAGFTDIPAYFATLQSDFGIPVFFTDGPGFIVDERETSFTYRLPLHQSIALSAEVAAQPGWNPSLSAQRQPISDQEAEERGWTLYWIGFQAMTSYAPESDTRARQ